MDAVPLDEIRDAGEVALGRHEADTSRTEIWVCHDVGTRPQETDDGQFQAAMPAAPRHVSNASTRKCRCVRAETR